MSRLSPVRIRSGAPLLAALLLAAPLAAQKAPDLKGVDAAIATMMADHNIPGMGVGLVRNGQVLIAKGYGYRDLEAKTPVTARTNFAIGSNSKSFTTVLMAMLVDEGKLDWNKPVRTWLPDFDLKDTYAAREMTPADLVSHVSGLPRHDLLWYGRHTTRQSIMERLKHLEPTTTFRGRFQYNNLMFITAGNLTERLTGKSWEAQVQERIFTPLGMTRSSTSVVEMAKTDDFSWAYDTRDGKVTRIPFRNIDVAGPAGSINASVEDMLKYINFRMHFGKYDGKQLVSAKQDSVMQTSRAVIPGGFYFGDEPALGPDTYAMALTVLAYRGHRVVMHGGGIDGFISQMAWLPDDGIGVVVLSNSTNSGAGGNPVPNAATFYLIDRALGLPPLDWTGKAKRTSFKADSAGKAARAKQAESRVAGTSPSQSLDNYVGRYENAGYGTLEVKRGATGLEFVMDELSGPLTHAHYDVFDFADQRLQGTRLTFGIDDAGKITTASAPLQPGVAPIVFTRNP